MPTVRFSLEPGADERLSITTKLFNRKPQIALDGQPLASQQQMGCHICTLPDGSKLYVKLHNGPMDRGWEATRNGNPLPGSIGTPEYAEKTGKRAGTFLICIAVFNLLVGLIMMFAGDENEISPGISRVVMGLSCIASAIVYSVLGFFVRRKLSLIALGVAIALFTVDGIVTLGMTAGATGHPPTSGFVVRFMFALMLVGAFRTLWRHKKTVSNTQ